jgi:endonuclease YncB( thermonuclease family)
MYEYRIKSVDHLVDGDTFDCTIDLGFNISHKIRVRMWGINTPESRTRDLEEKAKGLESKKRLMELLEENAGELILATKEKGKYGRYLGIVYHTNDECTPKVDINRQLIEEGYAVEYFGGKR